MAILLKKDTTVLVQGITGREGSARAAFMKGYGTKVVAGVTPGRGGEEVSGIPVFNTVEEAVRRRGPSMPASPLSPGPGLKDAVLEALDSGIKFIVSPVERVPLYDILEMVAYGKQKGARLSGPAPSGSSARESRPQAGSEEPRVCEEGIRAGTRGGHLQKRRTVGHGSLGHSSRQASA